MKKTTVKWITGLVAAALAATGCQSKRDPGVFGAGPGDLGAPAPGVPAGGGAGDAPSHASGGSQARASSGGSSAAGGGPQGYSVSGNLRNEPVSVPRVGGNSQVTLSRADVSGPYIAMTFDDGPHPSNTPRLLDILRQRNIKATFYVVGTNAKRYPQMLRQMVAEGHEIGNHTVNHVGLAQISNDRIRTELSQAHTAVLEACGVPPTTVRPPYGSVTSAQKQWIFDEFGYTTVLWSVDPRDWQKPGVSVVAKRLVEGTRNGSILLAHDIHKPTIDAMPSALDELLRRGFRFVTVSQLMALQGNAAVGPPRISATQSPPADLAGSRDTGGEEVAPADVEAASGTRDDAGEPGVSLAGAGEPSPLDTPSGNP